MDIGKALRSGVSQARAQQILRVYLHPLTAGQGRAKKHKSTRLVEFPMIGRTMQTKTNVAHGSQGRGLPAYGLRVTSTRAIHHLQHPGQSRRSCSYLQKRLRHLRRRLTQPPRNGPIWLPGLLSKMPKNLALQRQIPFYSILDQRRALRAHIDRKDQEANLKWQLRRFFSNPNGSSTAASSAAVSKLFDKYRGMMVSFSNRVTKSTQRCQKMREKNQTRSVWKVQ